MTRVSFQLATAANTAVKNLATTLLGAVSYTHLTLPTLLRVVIAVTSLYRYDSP